MRRLIAAVFVATLLLSPHVAPFNAQAEPARARGTIRAVDTAAGTVTLHLRNDSTLVLQTDDQTRILLNGEPATLEDLMAGDRATAVYESSTLVASLIEARGEARPELARVEGTIQAVDTAASTLTIHPLHNPNLVTLNVTNRTEITLDGRPARLGDLARGFTAGALYNPATFEAVRVQAESFAEVRGTVRDVSVPNQTLTVAPASGEPDIVLNVSPATVISLNDRPATLEDLRRGYRVVASFVATTHAAVRISATSIAEVAGFIRAIDLAASTLVIVPLVGGEPVELHVTNSTAITIGGEPARFEQLQVGMAATAVYGIATAEALRIAVRPLNECEIVRVAGPITEVNLHAATVTIAPAEGSPVTVNVVPRTEITIEGRPARLDDLRVGMRAVARVCRATLVA